jgi:uncharacterized protein (DUF2141 family)
VPIENTDPITIPAKAELVCDKIAINKLVIERNDLTNIWSATAELTFYNDDGEGNWTFARDDRGFLIRDYVFSRNVFSDAATTPELGAAILAIQSAVSVMLVAKRASQEATVGTMPPVAAVADLMLSVNP